MKTVISGILWGFLIGGVTWCVTAMILIADEPKEILNEITLVEGQGPYIKFANGDEISLESVYE